MIVATPLAVVSTIRLIPCLRVHDTELSFRNTVLKQEIRGNELAELELRNVLWGMFSVVDILRVASGSAEACVVSARSEEFEAHISVTVDAIQWRVDGDVLQNGGSRVA